MKVFKNILFFVLLILGNICFAQTIELTIKGLRNVRGSIVLSFYTNAKSFEKEIPAFVRAYPKSGMNNNKLNIIIDKLEPGTYGIALIDDENNNGKLDRRLLVPIEGFAFSNFPFIEKRKPAFDSFTFELQNKLIQVEFEVYYFTFNLKNKH